MVRNGAEFQTNVQNIETNVQTEAFDAKNNNTDTFQETDLSRN